jgi:hypothetical protein
MRCQWITEPRYTKDIKKNHKHEMQTIQRQHGIDPFPYTLEFLL